MSVQNSVDDLRDCTNSTLFLPLDHLPLELIPLFLKKNSSFDEIAKDSHTLSTFLNEILYKCPEKLEIIFKGFLKAKYQTEVELELHSCDCDAIKLIQTKFSISRIDLLNRSTNKEQVQDLFNSLPDLRVVEFSTTQALTCKDLASLVYPQNLEGVIFQNCHVNTQVLTSVLKLPRLDALHIIQPLDEIDFEEIKLSACRLSELRLERCVLTDQRVNAITKIFSEVRRVAFCRCKGTTVRVFSDCTFGDKLEELELIESTVAAKAFKNLIASQSLRSLNLYDCKNITSDAFVNLESKSLMRQLIVQNMQITAEEVQVLLTACPKLDSLGLADCKSLGPDDFYYFKYPKTLRSLDLRNTWIDLKGLNLLLLAFPNIESVSLRGCTALPPDCRYDNLAANILNSLLERHKDKLEDSPNRGKIANAIFEIQL